MRCLERAGLHLRRLLEPSRTDSETLMMLGLAFEVCSASSRSVRVYWARILRSNLGFAFRLIVVYLCISCPSLCLGLLLL